MAPLFSDMVVLLHPVRLPMLFVLPRAVAQTACANPLSISAKAAALDRASANLSDRPRVPLSDAAR